MLIKIIPGERNTEIIEKVKGLPKTSADDYCDALEILEDRYGRNAIMDALYYACDSRDEMLADQEVYLQDQLAGDEFVYYLSRFSPFDTLLDRV